MYKLKALYQYQNPVGNGASHTERFLLKIYQLVCLLLFFPIVYIQRTVWLWRRE